MSEQDFRELGLWWLPNDRERTVPGILTYSPTEGAELELIGTLCSVFDLACGPEPARVTDRDFAQAGNYGRICGVAGSKSFTLEGCFRIGVSNMLAPQPGGTTERIHVNRFVRGAEFEFEERVEATRIDVRLLHLPYWIAQGGVEETLRHPASNPSEGPNVSLEAYLLPDRIIELENGMVLSLCERVRVVGDRVTERGLRRDFNVRLQGARLDFDEYLAVIATFQDLVSIGTNRTSTFEHFTFEHPDVAQEREGHAPIPVPIEFYAQWSNWETRQPKSIGSHDLLFNLAELGDDVSIRRWCALALDHRGTVARVMGTRYRAGGFVSDKLLNRAAALEAFDRDSHQQDDLSFKERMIRLATLAGDPFLKAIGDVDLWARRFKRARIAAAHHSNRHPAEGVQSDYYLAETAYFLFVLCLLRHIQADERAFTRIADDGHFRDVTQHLLLTD